MKDNKKPFLKCESCGKEYSLMEKIWKCTCGGILDVTNISLFPKKELSSRPMNFWRYKESFTMGDMAEPVTLGEVMTPLIPVSFRGHDIECKLEYLMPTGSYKDRGIAVCMNQAKRMGIGSVAEDSSGNAGASVSAYSAAAGMEARVFVPEYTSKAKVNQIGVYGANISLVEGNRSDTEREAQKEREGVYYIGHSWNPLFECGVKTIAYEIAEQSGWKSPDWIVTPAGGGSLVLGLVHGFKEMFEAGYVEKMPRIIAVQSANCAPIYKAWMDDSDTIEPFDMKPTFAEGVALPYPVRGNQVLRALRDNDGVLMAVDEEEIKSAWKDSAEMGLFIEPTSAVALAGFWNAVEGDKLIGHEDRVAVIMTGHGLKTKTELMEKDI